MVKILFLLKYGLFSVVLLYSLPGASFFLSLSANTSTFSPVSRESRSLRFFGASRFFVYLSDLPCASFILQSLLKSYISLNCCLRSGSRLFSSIYSGEKPYFADRVLFKLKVAFLMNSFGLIHLLNTFTSLIHGFSVQLQILFHPSS